MSTAVAARCIACGGRLGSRTERLYYTERGAAYLCGRKRCEEAYNGQPSPPAPRRGKRA